MATFSGLDEKDARRAGFVQRAVAFKPNFRIFHLAGAE
jgi:hypothetical protein